MICIWEYIYDGAAVGVTGVRIPSQLPEITQWIVVLQNSEHQLTSCDGSIHGRKSSARKDVCDLHS